MNTTMDRLMDGTEIVEEIELLELGKVSEETRGSPVGTKMDGGYGARW